MNCSPDFIDAGERIPIPPSEMSRVHALSGRPHAPLAYGSMVSAQRRPTRGRARRAALPFPLSLFILVSVSWKMVAESSIIGPSLKTRPYPDRLHSCYRRLDCLGLALVSLLPPLPVRRGRGGGRGFFYPFIRPKNPSIIT